MRKWPAAAPQFTQHSRTPSSQPLLPSLHTTQFTYHPTLRLPAQPLADPGYPLPTPAFAGLTVNDSSQLSPGSLRNILPGPTDQINGTRVRPPGTLSPPGASLLPNIPVNGRSNELFRNSARPSSIVSHGSSAASGTRTTPSPPDNAPNTDRKPFIMADEKLCTCTFCAPTSSERSEQRT
jgi:hypothetical protein